MTWRSVVDDAEVIETARLDLVPLPADWLTAALTGAPRPDLGFADPHGFLDDAEDLIRLRLEQLSRAASLQPWLLRAIVLRDHRQAVGHINFHDAPDTDGMVEIGYTVVPSWRGQGIAREAAEGMWAWARSHGARILRASVAPDNEPSLRLLRSAGFVQDGEQMDEIDGLELVFVRNA